ncbi:MAG: inositol monophosphatase family protein [Alphaproteobacteria bacterium]
MVSGRLELDRVSDLIRSVAAEEIMPRWRNLKRHEIHEKGPGDQVTDADLATERRLTEGLAALIPGSLVVGEEAVAADEAILGHLNDPGAVWIIDPVDGTANFARGTDVFCVMVALVKAGETVAAWIYLPVDDQMALAERGSGAVLDGVPFEPSAETDPHRMRGSVHVRYMPKEKGRFVRPRLSSFRSNKEFYCAGHTYVHMARGDLDHALFWRTKCWDHAMGALIVTEAGGRVAFLDNTPYRPDIKGRTGLLATAQDETWLMVRDILWDGAPA